jgi:hypothetical protein
MVDTSEFDGGEVSVLLEENSQSFVNTASILEDPLDTTRSFQNDSVSPTNTNRLEGKHKHT